MCVCVCVGLIDFIAFYPHQKKKKTFIVMERTFKMDLLVTCYQTIFECQRYISPLV